MRKRGWLREVGPRRTRGAIQTFYMLTDEPLGLAKRTHPLLALENDDVCAKEAALALIDGYEVEPPAVHEPALRTHL